MYAEGERVAKEEGFDEISDTFKHIRRSEEHHEQRFRKLLNNVINDTVFKKDYETDWMCRKCGFVCHAENAHTLFMAIPHRTNVRTAIIRRLISRCFARIIRGLRAKGMTSDK